MSLTELQKLSLEVKELIFSEDFTDKNLAVADKFNLNQSQLSLVLDVEEKIWLKKIDVLDLPAELENAGISSDKDIRKLSLEIAINILWPLQDYLKNVNRLILRLGGKVPKLKHLRKLTLKNPGLPDTVKGVVKFLLEKYPDLKNKRLSSKKIISKNGRRVMPTITNWLEDYIHFLGAGYHNSLQRSKYLAKSLNILDTDEDEREVLRHFFTSYDDGLAIEIDSSNPVLIISEIKDKKDEEAIQPELKKVLAEIHQQIIDLDRDMVQPNIILSEAENNLNKLPDILWQALGLQDRDKVIGCLRVLITKKALDAMIKENHRFQSLMKRFVSVRYGESAGFGHDDKLLARRLFLELILGDKLNLTLSQATITVYYLTSLIQKSGQLVYFDSHDQQLKWREIQLLNNKVTWL